MKDPDSDKDPNAPKRTIIGMPAPTPEEDAPEADSAPGGGAGPEEKTVMAKGTGDAPAPGGDGSAAKKTAMLQGAPAPAGTDAGGHAGPEEKTVMASGTGEGDAAKGPQKTIIRPAPAPTEMLRKGPPPKRAAEVEVRAEGTPSPAGDAKATAEGTPPPAQQQAKVKEKTPALPTGGQTKPSASPLPDIGTMISHYEIIRKLGEGGMGTVYVARDTKLGRKVAIKFLQTAHPELTQRFILEARATARCSHENIVVIHEVGEFNNNPFMVLEYLRGTPLTDLIEDGKKLPPQRAVELMVPVVRALVTAHEQGIVHRDLKPDNVFVTDSGTIKVLDFGIAKVLQGTGKEEDKKKSQGTIILPSGEEFGSESTNLTRMGTIIGTMSFMSPEQWGIGVEIDHRTDIWACGIMLYMMMAGRHPLAPLQGQQLVITAALDQPMPGLRTAVPDVPGALADVVDRCLLKHKDKRWNDAQELLRALEPFMPGRFTRELKFDESPYAGLSAFQEADADRFFGRNNEIAAMVTRIRDRPLVAVVGSSGVGKSSFVRAGLVPALKASGETWETLVVRPGRDPLAALANILSPLVGTSTTVEDDLSHQTALIEKLREEPGYLGTVLRSRARLEKQKILVFVDQFEELYTLCPDEEARRVFTACLSGVADDALSPLRVVISIRSDFLDRVPEDPHFMSEISQGLFFLTSPNREGLREALVQPAEIAGYHFQTSDMVDDMLDHLENTHGALPLLQFAATKLWEARDASKQMLTKQSYDAIGGIAGALASHADSVLQELAPQAQSQVKGIFVRLVTPERTRAIVSIDELSEESKNPKELKNLIDHLAQARLLVVQTGGEESAGGASVELVHESLIHTWPLLRRWLDESHEDTVFLDQLRQAAKQWEAKGRDAGLLWRGEAMEEAKRWHKRFRGQLPKRQKEYLNAVFTLAARATRRKRVAVVFTIVFLAGLVAASMVALVIIRDSQQEAKAQAIAAKRAEKLAKDNEQLAKKNEQTAKEQEKIARQQAKIAQDRLAQVQQKEREKQHEVKLKEEAKAGEAAALTEVERKARELEIKNRELEAALREAEQSNTRAKKAQSEAEANAKKAFIAQKAAMKAQFQAERLLAQEKERAKRLEEQLGGSGIIETLK